VPLGGLYVYTGTVRNTGDVELTNIFVFSSQPNANTRVLGPLELAPGESQQFTGSYTVTTNSNQATGVVTTSGMDTCHGGTVTAAAGCSGAVLPLRIISVVHATNGFTTVTWTASPGSIYTLQCKTNVIDVNWINLVGNVTAISNTASKSDYVGSTVQRVYRVLLLP